MITDGDVLTAGFRPDEIVRREAELETLVSILEPATDNHYVDGAFIHGLRGGQDLYGTAGPRASESGVREQQEVGRNPPRSRRPPPKH